VSRLPSLSSRQIIAALRRAGFAEAPDRGKGSHRALFRRGPDGQIRLVIVPHGRDIPKGTLLAIIEQSGLSKDQFLGFI